MRKNGGMITHTIGAILAGGQSTRMGREKSGLLIEGQTFLDRVHETMTRVFKEVAVFGGSVVPTDGVLLRDEVPGQGPVGGLLTAMHMARGRPVFTTSVDTPLLTVDVIRAIAEPAVPSDGVRVATALGRVHPLIGVYGPDVEPVVRGRFDEGKRSMLGVIDTVERVVEVEVSPEAVFNVNTEEDYEQLMNRYGP
ncbi:MAG: molybdenum cofactor guanylyltransferase [Actinomycetota bacterium]